MDFLLVFFKRRRFNYFVYSRSIKYLTLNFFYILINILNFIYLLNITLFFVNDLVFYLIIDSWLSFELSIIKIWRRVKFHFNLMTKLLIYFFIWQDFIVSRGTQNNCLFNCILWFLTNVNTNFINIFFLKCIIALLLSINLIRSLF